MPDKDGRLTDPEWEKVLAWFNEKVPGGPPTCPMCSKKEWAVSRQLAAMQALTRPWIAIGAKFQLYPVVMLYCKYCAFLMPFGAKLIGVVEDGSENEEEELSQAVGKEDQDAKRS